MANFTPSGIIRIGRVPFDDSYRHTMTFADVASQTAFFASCCNQTFDNSTYTYVRMNNSIRVAFNAEMLYTYDYVMYQNSNYGNKWFYAFIVGVNYINENTTELLLELDVMQTWYFDYTLVRGFVEREHVDDDSIGLHINPEPEMPLEYLYDNFYPSTYENDNFYIVMLVTGIPVYEAAGGGQTKVKGIEAVSGGRYQNMFNACRALVYKPWIEASLNQFKLDIKDYNKGGGAEAIVDVYCAPVTSIDQNFLVQDGNGTMNRWHVADNSLPGIVENNIRRPLNLNGYTPRNNKLLCYPYCYLEIGDFTGRNEQYRWEFFDLTDTGYVVLKTSLCGVSDCQGYITPMYYNHIENAKTYKPFTFDFTNKVSWIFSTYQTWMAQNSMINQLAIIGSVAGIGAGAATGIGAAAGILGKGSASTANLMQLSGRNSAAGQALITSNAQDYAKRAMKAGIEGANTNAMSAGTLGALGTAANIYRMSKVPNSAKGNTAGNSKFQNGYCGWYMASVCIRGQFAHIVDEFFDMYGYQVDRVKIPNREGRRSWNYVKMQNSCHRGNVPSDQMAKINEIYNNGITFWHTSDVGNYSLNNDIV
ncbi:MAG: hypothetical protein IKE94_01185 [Aeriscardovia sp.]|nr:hypothetical protein [Aeriscardovia sp.]